MHARAALAARPAIKGVGIAVILICTGHARLFVVGDLRGHGQIWSSVKGVPLCTFRQYMRFQSVTGGCLILSRARNDWAQQKMKRR